MRQIEKVRPGRARKEMTDAVDEWVLQSMSEYQGKSFRSVTQGDLDEAGLGDMDGTF